MNKLIKTLTLAFFVLGMILASSLNATAHVQVQTKSQAVPATIKVGVLAAISGDLESIGAGVTDGIKAAALEINSSTTMGFKVALSIQDSKADPTTAVSAYETLKAQGVQLIIGATASAASKAVAEKTATDHIVQISYSSTASSLTNSSYDYFYRTVPSDAFQAQAFNALINHYNYTNIVIVNRGDAWGSGLATGLNDLFTNVSGHTVADTVTYPDGTTDFSSVVTSVKAATGAQAIADISFTEDGRSLVTELRSSGVTLPIFGVDGTADNSIVNTSIASHSKDDFQAFTGTKPHSDVAGEDNFNSYVSALDACKTASICVGNDPTRIYGNYAYDAMWVGADAVKLAGTYDGAAIKAKMAEAGASYIGATGNKTFDKYGDPNQATYDIYQFQSGNLTVIGTWNPSTGVVLNSKAESVTWPGRSSSTPGFDGVTLLFGIAVIAILPVIRKKIKKY